MGKDVKLTAEGVGAVMRSNGWTWMDVSKNDLNNKSNSYTILELDGRNTTFYVKGTRGRTSAEN